MELQPIPIRSRVSAFNRRVEHAVNRAVRTRDRVKAKLRLGGRKATYDDEHYEFLGGPSDVMRKKHYDKSMRLLWKAEEHMPWSSFRDCTRAERSLLDMAEKSLTKAERKHRARLGSQEYKDFLNATYTLEQKKAIVSVLSAIGHGEAYAWLVSAEVLADVQSTGAKAALTMQVLEEAKHFVVLRELLQAFDVPVPRLSAWEYLLLERVYKADGLEKLFGMNVLVEGIALSIFGLLADFPGLEVLRLFHLDESRHTALPLNYFKEFPMTNWQKKSPRARVRRLNMVLPAIPLLFYMEESLAVLGIDAFEFGGSIIRKVTHLAERAGFLLPLPAEQLAKHISLLFNLYGRLSRDSHTFTDYTTAETTRDAEARAVEVAIFQAN